MDNRYGKYGCPALMSDGRFVTNYMDSDVFNQFIRKVNKIPSSHEYRQFLQKNGDKLISRERNFLLKKYTCPSQGRCLSVDGDKAFKGCGVDAKPDSMFE